MACSAVGCTNSRQKGYRMFYFPMESKRRQLWAEALNRADWSPTNNSLLCTDHFTEECFQEKRGGTGLLKNAVPSIFFAESTCTKTTKRKKFILGCNPANTAAQVETYYTFEAIPSPSITSNTSDLSSNHDFDTATMGISNKPKCLPSQTVEPPKNHQRTALMNEISAFLKSRQQDVPAKDRWKKVFSEYVFCELDRYEYADAQNLKNQLNMVCLNFQPAQKIGGMVADTSSIQSQAGSSAIEFEGTSQICKIEPFYDEDVLN